ncbi:uncharacterized protein K02A2.6-like [Eupeodes corollae]|uniref:uncharacterized protein K02A2.6-like n=1 Tax=Eupeodes corollae TaxID=290404 RepID=UPI002492AB7F|nr:uncharacterized protein K02A2.6-like [Eupeodes corollae]
MSDKNKLKYQVATREDRCLSKILEYQANEWPDFKKLSLDCKKFHKIKFELSVNDGLLFFGDKLVVPFRLRDQVIKMLHESHLGIEKTRMRARRLFYWPGMSKDIEENIQRCRICEKFRYNNPKEPLKQHDSPEFAWEKISMDIFEHGGRSYLCVFDAYSNWLCVEKLQDKSIDHIINRIKSQLFAKFGVPLEIRSDNNPFNSRKFRDFAEEFNVRLVFSSPRYPQSNGLAEKGVAIAKRILKKCFEDGMEKDFLYRILEYNATPLANMLLSPAQLFMGREIKTKIPTTTNNLKPHNINSKDVSERIERKKDLQAEYYNRNSKPLSNLNENDKIMFKKDEKDWLYGTISKKVNDRSYIVNDSEDNKFRRNRRHIRCSLNRAPSNLLNDDIYTGNGNDHCNETIEMGSSENKDMQGGPSSENVVDVGIDVTDRPSNIVTRSGRVVRAPERYGY